MTSRIDAVTMVEQNCENYGYCLELVARVGKALGIFAAFVTLTVDSGN